jgi:hypothetical protein
VEWPSAAQVRRHTWATAQQVEAYSCDYPHGAPRIPSSPFLPSYNDAKVANRQVMWLDSPLGWSGWHRDVAARAKGGRAALQVAAQARWRGAGGQAACVTT